VYLVKNPGAEKAGGQLLMLAPRRLHDPVIRACKCARGAVVYHSVVYGVGASLGKDRLLYLRGGYTRVGARHFIYQEGRREGRRIFRPAFILRAPSDRSKAFCAMMQKALETF
jgi:hypothetical protein